MTKRNLNLKARIATSRMQPLSGTPFSRTRLDSPSTKLTGVVTYLHPTKGWRFRQPTPALLLSLAHLAQATSGVAR